MWAIDVRKPAASPTKAFRCAIYTRKSSEEGLEQDFNSLHAQRESCDAYIKSQRHEGWVPLPALYDDGGYPEDRRNGQRLSGCWPISNPI
jgi:site-specific DNA recombinase